MLPLPELDFLHARNVGCVTEGVHPPAEDERQFLVLHGNRQIERHFRLPAVAQQLLPRLMTQRAVQHVLHPPGDEADIRAVQGKFDKFPNRDAKFLHGALLSDKKRQTAASPSAALTAYFALFLHSAHRDFAPVGASRGLSGRPDTPSATTFAVVLTESVLREPYSSLLRPFRAFCACS